MTSCVHESVSDHKLRLSGTGQRGDQGSPRRDCRVVDVHPRRDRSGGTGRGLETTTLLRRGTARVSGLWTGVSLRTGWGLPVNRTCTCVLFLVLCPLDSCTDPKLELEVFDEPGVSSSRRGPESLGLDGITLHEDCDGNSSRGLGRDDRDQGSYDRWVLER